MLSARFLGKISLTVAIIAVLSYSPAYAQTAANEPHANLWDNENFDRQEFREEMQQIRHEHEDVDSERAALKSRCADAVDQQAAACASEEQALHERCLQLHDRVRILHEKVEALRQTQAQTGQAVNNRPADGLTTLSPTK